MDFDIFTVQGCMVPTSQTTALLMDWVAGAGGSSLLRVTMHLSDVWLALGVLQGNKAGILTTETLTLTLSQFGKCFLLQQFHLCTTLPSLSLSSFPSLPRCPYPLESPGKIPLGARNLEGKSLGTTSGIPLMVHSKELCPGGFNDNMSGASWSCLRENSCQLLSA